MIRPIVVLGPAWLLAVAGSGYWLSQIERVESAGVWTIARDAPANHQIQGHELNGPRSRTLLARLTPKESLTGRHLLRPKKRGEAIGLDDVSTQPGFATIADTGVVLYSVENEKQLAEGVMVGSWVRPCFTRPARTASLQTLTRCATDPVAVEAVHRPVANGDTTWLALRIPHCRLPEIGEFLAREERFVLLAEGPAVTHTHP
jgi:hypothetical protein